MQLFLYILLGLGCLACLASTSPTRESEYSIVNSTHYPAVRRNPLPQNSYSPLYHILAESRDVEEMLENGEEKDRISIISAKFDDKEPWQITCYNSQVATIITLVTSQGGIVVKIPSVRLKESSGPSESVKAHEYDLKIHQPVFGRNGLLTRRLLEWQQNSGGWWPDAIQIVVSTSGLQRQILHPRWAGVVNQIEKDLRYLWSFESNPQTAVRAQNILSGQRMVRTTLQSLINVKPGWDNRAGDAGRFGYAIEWKKTAISGEYQIWIGPESRNEPFTPDQNDGDGDLLVRLSNGRGWYPTTVQPLGAEPPGQGCRLKDMDTEC